MGMSSQGRLGCPKVAGDYGCKGREGLDIGWLSAGRTSLEEGLASEHLEPYLLAARTASIFLHCNSFIASVGRAHVLKANSRHGFRMGP